jgi:hypothetical protein
MTLTAKREAYKKRLEAYMLNNYGIVLNSLNFESCKLVMQKDEEIKALNWQFNKIINEIER